MARSKLGDILLRDNLVTKDQLEHALVNAGGARLGEALLTMGLITPDKLAQAIAKQFQLPFVALRDAIFDPDAVRLLNGRTAKRYQVVPIAKRDKILRLGISDPLNVQAIDDVSLITGCHVELVVMSPVDVERALSRLYPESGGAEGPDATTESTPVVRLVNRLVAQALEERASDIHLEPHDEGIKVRFRIDGMLTNITHLNKDMILPVVSRIKVMAGLDISERRLPQDGSIRFAEGSEGLDLRVSTLPTILGEKVVMRLLKSGKDQLTLDQIGLLASDRAEVENMLKSSYGMLLVTGPTGSGKTTSLYSALNIIHSPDKNIVTVEDPVEFRVAGISQVHVNPRIGLTFASVLRALVRQDPDVIMVGEIRDAETADIAIRSALTGHFVLSSLHTNDAPSTITRLVDMGVEPFLVGSSLVGIVAQRLVRRLCPHCRKMVAYGPHSPELLALGLAQADPLGLYTAVGCEKCGGEGYRGRVGLFEVLRMSEPMRELVTAGATTADIRRLARQSGSRSFREDGLEKARLGITTVQEVLRVAFQEG